MTAFCRMARARGPVEVCVGGGCGGVEKKQRNQARDAGSFLWGYVLLGGFNFAVKTGLREARQWRQSFVFHSSIEGSVQDLVLHDPAQSSQFTLLLCPWVQALDLG